MFSSNMLKQQGSETHVFCKILGRRDVPRKELMRAHEVRTLRWTQGVHRNTSWKRYDMNTLQSPKLSLFFPFGRSRLFWSLLLCSIFYVRLLLKVFMILLVGIKKANLATPWASFQVLPAPALLPAPLPWGFWSWCVALEAPTKTQKRCFLMFGQRPFWSFLGTTILQFSR